MLYDNVKFFGALQLLIVYNNPIFQIERNVFTIIAAL